MIGYNYSSQNYTNPYVSNYNYRFPVTQQSNEPYGINWVQGEAGARSFQVPPGQQVLLADSETNIIYLKTTDASGMPFPLRKFEYKEITGGETSAPQIAADNFITKEEFEKRITELESKLKEKKDGQFII